MLFKVLFLSVFLLVNLVAKAGTCVQYNVVGDTNCQNGDEEEIATTLPATEAVSPVVILPAVPQVQPEKELTEEEKLELKVDRFMEDYGKPPREYVRFNLNPTLENAMIWAQKFEEMNTRTQQVSKAWTQAQQIMEDRRNQGLELPGFEAGQAVPDFQKPVNPEDQRWLPPTVESDTPPALGFATQDDMRRQDNSLIRREVTPLNGGSLGGASYDSSLSAEPVEVSYYFSAQCPFCKKFEPEFQSLIKELGRYVLSVTCVDVTPAERTEKNIYGKVDCKWRSVAAGEMNLFGIRSTPTILIDKGDGSDLKKVEGLVDMKRLKAYLLEGRG